MEMGGKNPTIVLADADLDLAVNLVARAGFGLTGQACTATSRVIVEKSVAEAFTQKLVGESEIVENRQWIHAGHRHGPSRQREAASREISNTSASRRRKALN
jgi:acyl-CoA reductase-like NAD-dependent aldehyde dehydrogenase